MSGCAQGAQCHDTPSSNVSCLSPRFPLAADKHDTPMDYALLREAPPLTVFFTFEMSELEVGLQRRRSGFRSAPLKPQLRLPLRASLRLPLGTMRRASLLPQLPGAGNAPIIRLPRPRGPSHQPPQPRPRSRSPAAWRLHVCWLLTSADMRSRARFSLSSRSRPRPRRSCRAPSDTSSRQPWCYPRACPGSSPCRNR